MKKKFITRRFASAAALVLCLSTSMFLGSSCQAVEQTKENTAAIAQAEVKEDYMDISEKLIQPVAENSIFEKRADTAYGTVEKLTYYSQTAERDTPVNIILPPNYSSDKEYPVLYILHGFTDTQDWMLRDDVALVNMLGNLTNDGEIKEMIVVLPYIFCDKTQQFVNGFDISASPAYDNFINDLKTDLLDFINSSFPIKQGRENAAITGFSMGGRESLFIGVQMSDVFGYVGAACPAPGLTPVANSPMHPGQLTEDELTYDASKGVPYLTFITKGESDNVVGDSPLSYHNLLTANGNKNLFHTVPLGSHNASSVKQHLYNFTRMIFAVEESHYDDISFNDLTADENNITLTVTNDGTSKKAYALAAYYDKNDKLVSVSINKNTELKNGENTIQLENKSVGSYIKAYLWSGTDKMIPIASPKTVNQINTSVFPANKFEVLPLSYYDKTENGGRVEVLTYKTQDYLTNSGEMEKRAFVYLPSGYDKSKKYNVLYLLHGGNDSELWYFTNAGQASNYENVDFSTYDFSGSDLKNILDHITSSGEAEPFIVCTPTYQTPYDTTQMESIKIFHKELTNDLIPSLESKYSTYYDGSDITKSRMHRAFGGFSLGSAVTWNVFAGSLDSVGWFMPVSGDCWHLGMGSGKTNTVQTVDYLQSAAQSFGMTYKDFYIYGGCGNSSDIAYPNMIPQLEEMKSRTDGVFKYCDSFSDGNFYYCINPNNGHTIETVYNTLYNALPKFFKGIKEVEEAVEYEVEVNEMRIQNGSNSIYGKLYTPKKDGACPTVILSHGYNGCNSDFESACSFLAKNGFNAYAYDFCGGSTRSKSSGLSTDMTIFTEKSDLLAVIDHIKTMDNVDKDRLYLLGGSQGGLVSALAAEERIDSIKGMVLFFPAFNIPDDWRGNFKSDSDIPETYDFWGLTLGKSFFTSIRDFYTLDNIGKFNKNVLIIHGDKDVIVPVENAQKASTVYPNVELVILPGEGHGFSADGNKTAMKLALQLFQK